MRWGLLNKTSQQPFKKLLKYKKNSKFIMIKTIF